MKHSYLPLVCSALWLSVPVLAQTEAKPTDQSPLQIIQTDVPRFPFALDQSEVMSGDATVVIRVDRAGRLTDSLVTEYSRKEFADTEVEELKGYQYVPSRVNGEPWSSVQEVHFDFTRTGVVVSVSPFDAIMSRVEEIEKGRYAYRAHTLRELDRIPTPVQVVSPLSPALVGSEKKRTVSVDFYIDEQGRVRMPSVPRADVGTACAACALEAVRQWRFEPPMYKGRPALVLVRQQFNFVTKE
jgi:TonB family protein